MPRRAIIHAMTSPAASVLADKLLGEGARIREYFAGLSDAHWDQPLYTHEKTWRVTQVLEHLILSERNLLGLFKQVAAGGAGAPTDFDIDRFNLEHTGDLAELSRAKLLEAFEAQRAETASFARALSDEQLALRGRHPALGDSTVSEMLKMIYLHNAMHLKDVKRAAG
jgi:DinB superfamily